MASCKTACPRIQSKLFRKDKRRPHHLTNNGNQNCKSSIFHHSAHTFRLDISHTLDQLKENSHITLFSVQGVDIFYSYIVNLLFILRIKNAYHACVLSVEIHFVSGNDQYENVDAKYSRLILLGSKFDFHTF